MIYYLWASHLDALGFGKFEIYKLNCINARNLPLTPVTEKVVPHGAYGQMFHIDIKA